MWIGGQRGEGGGRGGRERGEGEGGGRGGEGEGEGDGEERVWDGWEGGGRKFVAVTPFSFSLGVCDIIASGDTAALRAEFGGGKGGREGERERVEVTILSLLL